MDILIIQSGLSSFVIFLIFHAVISRMTNAESAIYWLIRIYVMLLIFLLGGLLMGFGGLVWLVGSLAIYTLLCVLYVFGVFGVIEASITLRLLAEIGKMGETGITPRDISTRYNIDVILKRRLKRLQWSGELETVRGKYRLSRRFSYFIIREYFLEILRWIYPRTG